MATDGPTVEYKASDPASLPFDVNSSGPDAANPEWYRAFLNWELLHDLMGGTAAMQLAGQRWLPREDREEADVYDIRLKRNILFGGYSDAITNLSSRPFSQEISFDGYSDDFEAVFQDADGHGTSATAQTKQAMLYGAVHGHYYYIVDFTDTSVVDDAAELRAIKPRPSIKLICAPQLHAWTPNRSRRHDGPLESIRYRETKIVREDPDDPENMRMIRRVFIREINADGTWRKWESDQDRQNYTPYNEATDYWMTGTSYGDTWADKTWDLISEGKMDIPEKIGGIPIVPVYFDQSGPMMSRPPFRDLAEANLNHWRNSSDHRQLMRFARIVQMFATGVQADGDGVLDAMSNQRMYRFSNPQARLGMVEHSGASVEASLSDLDRIEEHMEKLGAQVHMRRRATSTAAGVNVNSQDAATDAMAFAMVAEMGLAKAIEFAHHWVEEDVPEKASVTIYKDFGNPLEGSEDMGVIGDMVDRGSASPQLEFREAQRRGIIDPGEDFDTVQDEIGEAALGNVSRQPDPEPAPVADPEVDADRTGEE